MSFSIPTGILQRISTAATLGAQRYSAGRSLPNVCPGESSRPSELSLPAPSSVTDKLQSIGLDAPSSDCIASVVTRIVITFKHGLEADFKRKSQSLQSEAQCLQDATFTSLISATYSAFYTKAIHHWTSYVIEDFVPRLLRARALQRETLRRVTEVDSQRRRPFNTNALPVLEQSFEKNAFPSRLEKFDLASQCQMEYRQIHVWFQNRRSRSRKEGKKLKQPEPRSVLAEVLENSVVDSLLPDDPHDEDSRDNTTHTLFALPSVESVLPGCNLRSPAHAYPSCYPPLCSYDPFPILPEQRNLQLPWTRRANSQPPVESTWRISQLTQAFAKLSTSEGRTVSSPSPSCVHRPSDSQSFSWPIGFVTLCSPAPHPAFVRRTRQRSRAPCRATGASTRLSTPGLRADNFTQRSTEDTFVTKESSPSILPPYQEHYRGPSRRFKRTLPRRIPQNPPVHSRPHATDSCIGNILSPPVMRKEEPITFPLSKPHTCDSLPPMSIPSPRGSKELSSDFGSVLAYSPEHGIQPFAQYLTSLSSLSGLFQQVETWTKRTEGLSPADGVAVRTEST